MDFTPSVISDSSATLEKLAVWLVVVIGIAAAMKFVACFLSFLGFAGLFFGKVGVHLLDPPLIMEFFLGTS